ncbi:MAG TPA: hypothetical protein VF593_02360 [Chthoniobacteraceae bacterium]
MRRIEIFRANDKPSDPSQDAVHLRSPGSSSGAMPATPERTRLSSPNPQEETASS